MDQMILEFCLPFQAWRILVLPHFFVSVKISFFNLKHSIWKWIGFLWRNICHLLKRSGYWSGSQRLGGNGWKWTDWNPPLETQSGFRFTLAWLWPSLRALSIIDGETCLSENQDEEEVLLQPGAQQDRNRTKTKQNKTSKAQKNSFKPENVLIPK